MYWRDNFHRLQFNDYQVLEHEIHSISQVQLHAAIHHGKASLGDRPDSGITEFILQAGSIRIFKKPRSKFGVDSHGSSDDRMTHLLRCETTNARGSREGILTGRSR
jgi:hypothetical protein